MFSSHGVSPKKRRTGNMSNNPEDERGGSVATDSRPAGESKPAVCTENQTETDSFIRSYLDPAEEYKMGNKRRGLALIFNQERFFWRLGLNDRSGTNADRDNLEKSLSPLCTKCDRGPIVADFTVVHVVPTASETEELKDLNFEVRCYDNYKQEAVLDEIAKAAEEDHSDADCFLLAFLSHGEDNHVYCHDGKISIQEITSMFKGDNCQDLVGKPKIFVIQACRGEKHDHPVTPADAVDGIVEVFVDASAIHTLPAGADFIMCYSVAEGYYSHRETFNGSWYIQDLCELLKERGDTLEFTELLTLVNRKVAMRSVLRARDPRAIGKKQVPCFASMLTKKLYFRPKK